MTCRSQCAWQTSRRCAASLLLIYLCCAHVSRGGCAGVEQDQPQCAGRRGQARGMDEEARGDLSGRASCACAEQLSAHVKGRRVIIEPLNLRGGDKIATLSIYLVSALSSSSPMLTSLEPTNCSRPVHVAAGSGGCLSLASCPARLAGVSATLNICASCFASCTHFAVTGYVKVRSTLQASQPRCFCGLTTRQAGWALTRLLTRQLWGCTRLRASSRFRPTSSREFCSEPLVHTWRSGR